MNSQKDCLNILRIIFYSHLHIFQLQAYYTYTMQIHNCHLNSFYMKLKFYKINSFSDVHSIYASSNTWGYLIHVSIRHMYSSNI